VDTSNSLSPDSHSKSLAESHRAIDDERGAFVRAYENEDPSVLIARVGVCAFASFVFPASLWMIGAVTPALACVAAAALTLLTTRPVLLVGGPRVARVVLLEILMALVLLPRVMDPLFAVSAAVFWPLLGTFALASLGARVADQAFAEDERPHEVEAAVARAMQSNVVDIRSAEAARRAAKKSRGQASGTAVTPSLQSQI
jgi:hypothetical protein